MFCVYSTRYADILVNKRAYRLTRMPAYKTIVATLIVTKLLQKQTKPYSGCLTAYTSVKHIHVKLPHMASIVTVTAT